MAGKEKAEREIVFTCKILGLRALEDKTVLTRLFAKWLDLGEVSKKSNPLIDVDTPGNVRGMASFL